MQSISVFLEYSKICWFPAKNADVSRTRRLFHVIYVSFWISFFSKFHHCRICVTSFRKGWSFCSPSQPWPKCLSRIWSKLSLLDNKTALLCQFRKMNQKKRCKYKRTKRIIDKTYNWTDKKLTIFHIFPFYI